MIDKLNILFLFTDQIHVFAMGYMDTSDIYAPGSLVGEGVLFKNSYSNAPVEPRFESNQVELNRSAFRSRFGVIA